jgi:hypothetical protein
MNDTASVPGLMIADVLTAGGPYRAGEALSIAFAEPTVGRLVRHDDLGDAPLEASGIVPQTISIRVTIAAEPYGTGDVLTLSFLDPRFARIHAAPRTELPAGPATAAGAPAPVASPIRQDAPLPEVAPTPERAPGTEMPSANGRAVVEAPLASAAEPQPMPKTTGQPDRADGRAGAARTQSRAITPTANGTPPGFDATGSGVRLALDWGPVRARRFVAVVDKLFTVDRLGWYRHVIAMRLLVPDRISCGDEEATRSAGQHLRALRAATTETLGRPLLAAFMPNFSVTPEWLAAIETGAIAQALDELRDAILPLIKDTAAAASDFKFAETTSWAILQERDITAAAAGADAFIATLVPAHACDAAFTEHLEAYRSSLVDAFAQTARSLEAIRLGRMAEPNHVLDDRLWQLTGFVGTKLGGALQPAGT